MFGRLLNNVQTCINCHTCVGQHSDYVWNCFGHVSDHVRLYDACMRLCKHIKRHNIKSSQARTLQHKKLPDKFSQYTAATAREIFSKNETTSNTKHDPCCAFPNGLAVLSEQSGGGFLNGPAICFCMVRPCLSE